MAVEITVQLFPAAGGGIQIIQTPQGQIPVPIPFLNYERVREVIRADKDGIEFVHRDGSSIETNIRYLIKRTNVAEGEA